MNIATDWSRIADRIVNHTMQVQRGERVLYMVDPVRFAALFDAVRSAVLAAGGIELATIAAWTPQAAERRTPEGANPDDELAVEETRAAKGLLELADVFMWLPNDWLGAGAVTMGQTESLLGAWHGRGLHFHWFPDFVAEADSPVNAEIAKVYEDAILNLDYDAHRATQQRFVSAIRGALLHVTDPLGTDLSVQLAGDGWYHCNDGLAGPDKPRAPGSARDREEELPCGSVRTIPLAASVEGVIRFMAGPSESLPGGHLDLWDSQGMVEIEFARGQVVAFRADDRALVAQYKAWSGDSDRLGELVFGTNPLLRPVPGAHLPTYWGFGEGVVRFHLGDNTESGGNLHSPQTLRIWRTEATLVADGAKIVSGGKLQLS